MQQQSSFIYLANEQQNQRPMSHTQFRTELNRQILQLNRNIVEMHNIAEDDEEILNQLQEDNQKLSVLIKNIKTYMSSRNIPFDYNKIQNVLNPTNVNPQQKLLMQQERGNENQTSLQDKMNNIIKERKQKQKSHSRNI